MRIILVMILCVMASAVTAKAPNFVGDAGGEGSVVARGADAFSHPARNSSPTHRRSFAVGNSLFKENWVAPPASVKLRQGLGPQFNAQSCSSCHFKDGRGRPPGGPGEPFVSMLIRLSIPGVTKQGGPVPVPHYGDQLNHRSVVGVTAEGDVRVDYKKISGSYPDGTPFELLDPHYSFQNLRFGPLPKDVKISARVAPGLIGLGLLEAVSEETIRALADPDDKDGDGIRGRINMVWDVASGSKRLGRFGWKANQPSLLQQNAGAFFGDMGITSPLFSDSGCSKLASDCIRASQITKDVEISAKNLAHVTAYTKLLAVPVRRQHDEPTVMAGALAFRSSGCESCHVPQMTTGTDPEFPENSNQTIHPYTDLLLHDMGDGLADDRPDFEADGRSWRTPPLWGIGLVEEVNGHTRFLHDGRARSLEEAILWHGGEAENAKLLFTRMTKDQRRSLLKFLESL